LVEKVIVNQLIELFQSLDDSHWLAILTDQALLMQNDMELVIGPDDAPNVLLAASDFHSKQPEQMKQEVINNAEAILASYYLSHPLTLTGFNDQVYRLVKQYSIAAFCAEEGHRAERTLFIEAGEVLALSKEDLRHAYGVFFEFSGPLTGIALENHFSQWIEQGEAYERYLSMNVCRYNC
jgi:hypothetical protein